MVTGLTKSSCVRQTAEVEQRSGQPLLIKLEVGGRIIKIKPKRAREWFVVTVKDLWLQGAKNKAHELKLLKEQKKRDRQAARRK